MNDLLFTQGGDNMAGLVDQIYSCPVANIASLPALAAATSLKTAAANIVCTTGNNFKKVYFTDESAKIITKTVGPRDGRCRENMLTYKFPVALSVEVADHISDNQNTPSVLIVRKPTGKLYLLGVARLDKASTVLSIIPAYFEQGDADTGEKRADEHGTLLGWKFTCSHDPI